MGAEPRRHLDHQDDARPRGDVALLLVELLDLRSALVELGPARGHAVVAREQDEGTVGE